ncbi:hypothetical protein TWF694_000214 [Orbilia ellipsospora]|uniref:Uncharacterized protein n=1 Tax=Orbilia ellipsospora TaxID=2528407 RepID=A0AAV9XUL9_9PEZI
MSGLPPNSLQGYDTVIQISQEAIEQQLKVLWKTRVKKPVPGGPRHYIDHIFNVHSTVEVKDREGKVTGTRASSEGFDGYVKWPTIDFTGSAVHETERYSTARVTFEFTTADEVFAPHEIPKGKSSDSIFTALVKEWDEELGAEQLRKDLKVINGWKISWKGVIAQKAIANVLDRIVGSTYVPESLQNSLSKAKVNPSVFSISSIFCLFQSAQVASSFEVRDKDGVIQEDAKLRTSMITLLNTVFAAPQDQQGIPDPKTPFVLGYMISTVNPKTEQTSKVVTRDTPPYFVPKSVFMTITPGLGTKDARTVGTLNFCMTTYRLPGETERAVDSYSANQEKGGRFQTPFFDIVKMKAMPSTTDGMIAFSNDIFYNNWMLKDLEPRFNIDYATDFYEIDDRRAYSDSLKNLCAGKFRPATTSSGTRKYATSEGLHQKITRRREDIDSGLPVQLSDSFYFEFKKATSYTSTYAKDSSIGDSLDDTKRRVIIKLTAILDYLLEWNWYSDALNFSGVADTIGGLFSGGENEAEKRANRNFASDDKWKTFATARGTAIIGFEFELGVDPKNRGKFHVSSINQLHKDKSNIRHLSGRGPTTRISNGEITGFTESPYNYGLHTELIWDDNFEGAAKVIPIVKEKFDTTNEDVKKAFSRLGDRFIDRVSGIAENFVDQLGSTIILPAGDVFQFKGLSTDANGNVYSGVTYDTPSELKMELKQGQEITRA